MLLLSRGKGEQILIGQNVKLMVVSICTRSGKEIPKAMVRIGIEAPKEVDIIRPDAKNKRPSPQQEAQASVPSRSDGAE